MAPPLPLQSPRRPWSSYPEPVLLRRLLLHSALTTPASPSRSCPKPSARTALTYLHGSLLHILQVFTQHHLLSEFSWPPYLKSKSFLCPPLFTTLFFYCLNLKICKMHILLMRLCVVYLPPVEASWRQGFCLFCLLLQVQSLSRVRLFVIPWDCSMPGLPVHHQLPEFTQTHVHQVGDAIQPSHPLLSPSPPAFNLSLHHGLFRWVSSLHQVAKVLEFQLQHQSFQWIFRTDLL